MIALIPKTRCQGLWQGDADGSAGYGWCPYKRASSLWPWCNFCRKALSDDGRRLKGCAFGRQVVTIRVEVSDV